MSAHRLNYTPEPERRSTPWHHSLPASVALIGVSIGVGVLCALLQRPTAPVVRLNDPIEQRLAQIRAEAFRAGYASAAQDGCRPAMTMPIARVQP